jgi:Transglycosylase SLT domain
MRRAPLRAQLAGAALALALAWFLLNGLYQVLRKPAELFYPVSGVLSKTPAETWAQYEPIFREHATAVITPDLLAALAQVEASGNPVATPEWRWRLTARPFDVYRPASSAVGMYQITDGTFAQAKRYCIHDHAVAEDGPWHELGSCWFNWLYMRIVPSHAAEMTAALLDRRVAEILARPGMPRATLQQKQDLAAVIHLCGAAAGEAYAARRFALAPHQRCGEHDAHAYLARVNAMKRWFCTRLGRACPGR